METMVWRVLGTGSAVLAGILANKIVTELWKHSGRDEIHDPATRGHRPRRQSCSRR